MKPLEHVGGMDELVRFVKETKEYGRPRSMSGTHRESSTGYAQHTDGTRGGRGGGSSSPNSHHHDN